MPVETLSILVSLHFYMWQKLSDSNCNYSTFCKGHIHSSLRLWTIRKIKAAYICFLFTRDIRSSYFLVFHDIIPPVIPPPAHSIYVVSTLIGGMIIGKLTKSKRYLWGMVLGIIYFVLLLLITLGVYRTLNGDSVSIVTSLILCAGGGMTGGMISWKTKK